MISSIGRKGNRHYFSQMNKTALTKAILDMNPFNPLSPNSDQHQFSPKNIHMLPREMVMRVNKMITKEKML